MTRIIDSFETTLSLGGMESGVRGVGVGGWNLAERGWKEGKESG